MLRALGMGFWVGLLSAGPAPAADTYFVGTARVDITPEHPIRLNGFGSRRAESEGVHRRIFARAISLRHPDDPQPLVLLTVDVLGIPESIREQLEKRLQGKIAPERLAIAATHTHCGPMLSGANPTLFGVPIPEAHQKHIDAYTPVFLDKLEAAALSALKDPQSCRLAWGVGRAGFARNRRTKGGPVDHDLPVLVARDAATDRVRAVYTNYACHCVTLSHNKIGGDWAGEAAAAIEAACPDAVGLVAIGCGADQNPDSGVTGDKAEIAAAQGREIAGEIQRLAAGWLAPVRGKPVCTLNALTLPLAALPDRAGWEEKAKRADAIGHHARVQLAKLDRGEALPASVSYPVQTWAYGESLAMVHLGGEVVVDFSLRLKDELDRSRLWVTAYANTNPCYIPSERMLKEGGYEGGGAMVYYDLPVPFKPGLEAAIVGEVKAQIGASFAATFDASRTRGERPLSPQQSQRSLKVEAAFAVELVAAEPLVADPVAIAFGPDGKLWVAEMLDYPSGRTGKFEPGGRIRFLEDSTGRGRFDRATTFLDNVPFPTGVLPWRKGVLICAAPDILYAEDTNGDGRADIVTKLYSGFGTENFQGRVNGLAYGLDGWVHGACGLFGGTIRSHKTGKSLALGDRDFRIRPDTGEIEPATGRTQQGRVRDDAGNWFGCDNSTLAWQIVLPDHYLRRNPFVAPPPTAPLLVGPDANRLFPLRTPQLFQLSGPVGRTTGACGLGIYRDDWLGSSMTGNAFTCEPVNLVVHRRKLTPKDSILQGVRNPAERDREFLAATDPWFRPVQATTGPDGALWIADMYRFVIEHPRWIPPGDLAKLDVRAGAGLGRLWRVRPAQGPARNWPRLDKLGTNELVAALDSPNGWQRDMATELLAWANDKAAIAPLRKLAADCPRPEARLHALVTLDRLGGLTAQTLIAALADSSPVVRRHAVRLAEPFFNSPEMARSVAALVRDPDASVRLQVTFSLGEWHDARAAEPLAQLAAAHRGDEFLLAAVVSSLNRANLAGFAARPEIASLAATPLLPKLLATARGLKDDAALGTLTKLITSARDGHYEPWQFAGLRLLLESPGHDAEAAKTILTAARQIALDEKMEMSLRIAAIPLLTFDKSRDGLADLAALLVPQSPPPVQTAALAALARHDAARGAETILASWPGLSPALQAQAVDSLLKRESSILKLLTAVADGKISAAAIPVHDRQSLLSHASAAIRARAEKVFAGAIDKDRQKVIDEYLKSLPKSGDVAKGRAAFRKTCAACHQLEGHGHAIGPDLSMVAAKTRDYLLTEILDPNRNLDSRYVEYKAVTADGRTFTGLLAVETAAAVTLRRADGKEQTLLRTDLESFKSTARSLMPDGVEKDLPPAAMADLLAYLAAAGASPPPKP